VLLLILSLMPMIRRLQTLSDGRFIIAYTVDSSGGTNTGVRAHIYNEDGTVSTGVLNFATTVAGNQAETEVVALPNGESIVFWIDSETFDVHGQRLSTTGTNIGSEFDVRNFSATDTSGISATLMDDGRVQVTWQEEFATDRVT
jgi:hypothetical protein